MANQMTTTGRGNNDRNLAVQNASRGDFRNMLSTFLNMFDLPATSSMSSVSDMEPRIEVAEDENEVMVLAELPGVAEEDIDVEISADGYLTISGDKYDEYEDNHKGNYFSEISYGHVQRTIPLPQDLKFDQADAEYSDGILSISIPKSADAQQKRKKIAVSHNEGGSKRKNRKNRNRNNQQQTRQ